MVAYDGNRHIWVLYVLCGLATLAVIAAVVIPGVQWVLRPTNCIPVVAALSLVSSLRVFRGWGRFVIWLVILGITQNYLHQSLIK